MFKRVKKQQSPIQFLCGIHARNSQTECRVYTSIDLLYRNCLDCYRHNIQCLHGNKTMIVMKHCNLRVYFSHDSLRNHSSWLIYIAVHESAQNIGLNRLFQSLYLFFCNLYSYYLLNHFWNLFIAYFFMTTNHGEK